MMAEPAEVQDIQGPAVEREGHVWGRPATDDKMRPITGKVACSVITPLERAFERGQLDGGNPKYNGVARFNAGMGYAGVFKASQPGGRDSTQALNISRSSTLGANNDSQQRAWDARLSIESCLTPADRKIVQMVCGEDYTPAEAVKIVCNDYRFTVPARFREALDNLIAAMEWAHRNPGKFNMRRDG